MTAHSQLATRRSGSVDGSTTVGEPGRVETLDLPGLVRQAQHGDTEAFNRLYRLRIAPIGRYIGAIVRDASRTEEAVAETFLQVWRDLGKLREAERFDGWLYRIAYRRALAEVQRRRLEPLEAADQVADQRRDGNPEDSLDAVLTSEAVRRALLGLSDAHREVLVLRHIAELTHREIAAQLGKSEDAVRMAYSRAVRALRTQMG